MIPSVLDDEVVLIPVVVVMFISVMLEIRGKISMEYDGESELLVFYSADFRHRSESITFYPPLGSLTCSVGVFIMQ